MRNRKLKQIYSFLMVLVFFLIPLSGKPLKKRGIGNYTKLFENLKFRNIGPAIMGGRLTDIEGIKGDYRVFYISSASGGLWKTENGGVSWKPLFDKQELLSIGDFALAPSNHSIIYVGTGEDNPRNSSSFGNGVYKSTDGGKTWKYIGLKGTERISRIIINPDNPDIVYVAAIGPVFGASNNRGVFMSRDGGKTWKKTLYIDKYHGASDLAIDPDNPNILYAGMWYFQRKLWKFTSGDTKGGVYKSIDGGKTWKKIEKGFPKLMGRIAVKIAPSNPDIIYVLVESKEGVLYKSENGGDSFKLINKNFEIVNRGFYYTELRIDPKDENRVYAISSRLWMSEDGGKRFKRIAKNIHVDFHTMWIDSENPSHILVGNDGGLYVSYDRGKTWEFINNLVISQFYHISIDEQQPFYYVCGGLQDNGSWCGPSRTKYFYGIPNDFWYSIGGGDGFYVVSNPNKEKVYLSEYQAGGISHLNLKTGEDIPNSPYPRRNDGGPVSKLKYRFNWNSPIIKSSHKKERVYFAGNVVFRSDDFGISWEKISPDLTTNNREKINGGGGPIYKENTTAEYYCTITALAESPVDENVLWAGTDDGNLYYTKDGGKHWIKVINNIKKLGKESYVSYIEPSKWSVSSAYVSFDRHMLNDFKPYIFKTDNFGKTWKKISSNLPKINYVHVVKGSPNKKGLLFAGTEKGLYISWNDGKRWDKLNMKNLPNVPVYDMKIYDNDLILATHGRGVWIFDNISPIEEIENKSKGITIFSIKDPIRYLSYSVRESMGDKYFVGPNPPYGALIYYYIDNISENKGKYKLEIFNTKGELIREIKLNPKKGINLAVWDLRYNPAKPRKIGDKPIRGWFGGSMGPYVLPGEYIVKIKGVGKEESAKLNVKIDPTVKYDINALKKQLSFALKLRDKISTVNLKLRRLDNIEKQLVNLRNLINSSEINPDKKVLEKIDLFLKKTISIKKELARYTSNYWMEGNKLLEELMDVYVAVQRGFSAPLKQITDVYNNEILPEYIKKMRNTDEFFEKDLKDFNVFLKEKKGIKIL